MGSTISNEKKSEFLKFRITPTFKQTLMDLKMSTPGCASMNFQDYVVRLIELGIIEESGRNRIADSARQDEELSAVQKEAKNAG